MKKTFEALTSQQEKALVIYENEKRELCESMNIDYVFDPDDFTTWYSHYCYEKNYFNDLMGNEISFE